MEYKSIPMRRQKNALVEAVILELQNNIECLLHEASTAHSEWLAIDGKDADKKRHMIFGEILAYARVRNKLNAIVNSKDELR